MKIARMKKGSWGKIRAFFDIETEDGFIIKGFKVVEADGLFVGFPSQKDKDGEYQDTVGCNKELRQEINLMAHKHYHGEEIVESPTRPSNTPIDPNENSSFNGM